MNTKTEYLLDQVYKLKEKPFEIAILSPLIMCKELSIIMPYTQYPVNSGEYYIDLFYPDLKIAIEIDEDHHEATISEDQERQKNIEEKESCRFHRVRTSDIEDIYESIEKIKQFLLSEIEEFKRSNNFKEWEAISHQIDQVQEDYPNAVFFKATKKQLADGFDPSRGPLMISEEIRENADLFVTYSGDTVTKVFELSKPVWGEYQPNRKLGFYQNGREIPNHPLISSGSTKWNTTSNRVVGKNLKR